ncbi:unnamed protein product, partial [marine sediment metagenome]
MAKIWTWLNGNKTVIGTLILAVLSTGIIGDHTFGYEVLLWLGGLLAGGGLIHKVVKPADANS